MKITIAKMVKWLEPLVTERDQISHEQQASMGRIMGWATLMLDFFVVVYILRTGKKVPHADLIFNFLEILTLFVLSFAFSHKLILLKNKFNVAGDANENGKPPDIQ